MDIKKLERLSALKDMGHVDLEGVWTMMEEIVEVDCPSVVDAKMPATVFAQKSEPVVEREEFTAPRVVRKK